MHTSALLLALIPAAATAATVTELPDDAALHWGPAPASLPAGTTIATLSGDPAKPGPFTLRLRFPAEATVAPHTHTQDETVTVLRGRILHETGRTLDRSRGMVVNTLGFVFLPAGMPHSVWTTTEAAEVQVSGSGPFGVTYITGATR